MICTLCRAEMKQKSREELSVWLWERPCQLGCSRPDPDCFLYLQLPTEASEMRYGRALGCLCDFNRNGKDLLAEGRMAESCSQWGVQDEKCFSPSLQGTFCLALASVLQNTAAGARPGAQISASSAVSWLHQAKGG